MSSDRKKEPSKPNRTRPQTQRTKSQSKIGTSTTTTEKWGRWFKTTGLGHLLVGVWAISGAIATTVNSTLVQSMERQTQTLFFQLRGSVKSPDNIVILAIDEFSIDQAKYYRDDSQKLADFEPMQTWPWKREAYAKAIKRLMGAGAKAVAVDVVFDGPSTYGEADDEQLRQVLQEYAGKVTLAAIYDESDQARLGGFIRLIQPDSLFQTSPMSVGSINYLIEPDGRIHRLGSEFPKVWAQNNPEEAKEFFEFVATIPSFDEAVLQAAGLTYPKPKGDDIFFYGSPQTFEHIPFSNVLDPGNWNTYLKEGKYFKDKIVIIGPTATISQDFHQTPFSAFTKSMPGVEIHANAIATLLEGRSISEGIPNPIQRGILVFIGVIGAGFLITRIKNLPIRLGVAAGVVLAWGGISWALFVFGRLIVPTAVPIAAIGLSSLSYGIIGSIRDYFSKRNIQRTIKRYSSSPIIREMISEAEEFQGMLEEREIELLETKLGGRYQIVKRLSSGGFGETYIAEDNQRPGNPKCVVKKLSPASNSPKLWELARRLFIKEAETLEKLGNHDQIPQLLAHFEEGEFYLVQEFIIGRPLTNELPILVPLSEVKVIEIIRELLLVLEFIHSHGVIHRDIKPDNIIRRESDGKLVLIDFGAVKELGTKLGEGEQRTELTVGIGTKGYMPSEQAAGNPKYNSDIYAVGMIAIQGLTLTHPVHLPSDPRTGELIWEDKAQVSPELAAILKKMVHYNFRDRYQSTTDVLEALNLVILTESPNLSKRSQTKNKTTNDSSSVKDTQDSTQVWSESSTPQDSEDSTKVWSESSDEQESQDSTKVWSESSDEQEPQDSTKVWSESSDEQEPQDSTN